ncbi:hypothetical protein DW954_02255 [Clostridium sp. AM45-5]|nr:hypothetical protein [Clostridium sp. AM45-5]RHS68179.1 hypothetical protein DW954_02255 [Clostridium sp. AM45-5]
MLKIEIETGNAVFCDPYTGEEDRHFEGFELNRILEGIKMKIAEGYTNGTCFDINGNRVGWWSR